LAIAVDLPTLRVYYEISYVGVPTGSFFLKSSYSPVRRILYIIV